MYLQIETERLRIRPIQLRDAPFIFELVNSDGWLQFIGDRNISDTEVAEKYIQNILNKPNFFYNVIELKTSQIAMGIVTFLKRVDEKFPDFGFALLPEFEKNGYALEASKAYLEKINEGHTYGNIVAITMPENHKSVNLLRKLGFQYTGDLKKGAKFLSYYSLKK